MSGGAGRYVHSLHHCVSRRDAPSHDASLNDALPYIDPFYYRLSRCHDRFYDANLRDALPFDDVI